jgi:hypothetical protein
MKELFSIEDIKKRSKGGSNLMETNLGSNKSIEQVNENNIKIVNQEQKMRIKIEVISKEEDIIKNETDRILWYLKNYERYEKLGYSEYLNLPTSIDPKNYKREDVEKAVQQDYLKNKNDYESYALELKNTWDKIIDKMSSAMQGLYGFTPSNNFILAPTVYGTGGGSLEKDGIIFFKLPEDRSQERSTEERITHEVLNHEATANLREGTEIDESISTSHQWYKERLMDLLGRTLLVRTGILDRKKVKMDGDIEQQVASIVDPIYYLNPENPDENNLRYEGNIKDLFKAVIEKIKTDNIQVSNKIG